MATALDGIRVIDLTVWFQGPVAAQYLADFGAEVIHVERPKGGDQGRGHSVSPSAENSGFAMKSISVRSKPSAS